MAISFPDGATEEIRTPTNRDTTYRASHYTTAAMTDFQNLHLVQVHHGPLGKN